MDAHDLSALAQRYTDAWNAHDAAAVAACFSEDGSFAVDSGDPAVGRAAVQSAMQRYFDAYPDSALTMDDVRGAGDRAVYLWTAEITAKATDGTEQNVRFGGWDAWTLSPTGQLRESLGNYSLP